MAPSNPRPIRSASRGRRVRRGAALGLALVPALALVAAPGPGPADGATAATAEPLPVTVSIHPLALLVREVGGDQVAVRTLLPPGASPHGYEPSPSDVRSLADARLLVTVGGGLDPWADRLARGLGLKGAHLALAEQGHMRPAGVGHVHADHGHDDGDHAEGTGDPHVWLDPLWVRDHAVPALERALSGVAPDHAETFRARGQDFAARLTALDRELSETLAPVRGEAFVAFHGSWGYFADRYGLNQVAVVEPLPGREPSARWMAEVVRAARESGARTVLVEPQLMSRAGRTVAEQFGGRTVLVDPLGVPGATAAGGAGATYEGLMRFNAGAFREGLAP